MVNSNYLFGNLGGGSPFAKIAAIVAEHSAENSLFIGKNAMEIGEIEGFCNIEGRVMMIKRTRRAPRPYESRLCLGLDRILQIREADRTLGTNAQREQFTRVALHRLDLHRMFNPSNDFNRIYDHAEIRG